MRVLSLLSGGMDSATGLGWAKKHHQVVGALSFWYGSKHNEMEYKSAQLLSTFYDVPLKRIRLDFIAEHFKSDLLLTGAPVPEGHYADPSMKKTVVPFRNGIMLSIAAGYAESIGAEAVVLSNHVGDHAIYPDCRKEFTQAMSQAITMGTYAQVQMLTPFGDISKTGIAKLGGGLGVPYELTYSCYAGGEIHCGACGTCYERKEAFRDAALSDPTKYSK